LGGIGGFAVGYSIKKLFKLVAFIFGIFFLVLIYLGYAGVISVDYGKLEEIVSQSLGITGQGLELIRLIAAHLPFEATFTAGFVLGFKKG